MLFPTQNMIKTPKKDTYITLPPAFKRLKRHLALETQIKYKRSMNSNFVAGTTREIEILLILIFPQKTILHIHSAKGRIEKTVYLIVRSGLHKMQISVE